MMWYVAELFVACMLIEVDINSIRDKVDEGMSARFEDCLL
jgi:hypothetical protein